MRIIAKGPREFNNFVGLILSFDLHLRKPQALAAVALARLDTRPIRQAYWPA
jgi:hypothetical protein